MVPIAALLLADGRLPNGGHAHSGGMEEAVNQGLVGDVASLRSFLVGLAHTVGLQTAVLAGAVCWCCGECAEAALPGPKAKCGGFTESHSANPPHFEFLVSLDAEADARMCSPAQRQASRQRGRQLLRVARRAWPSPVLDSLDSLARAGPRSNWEGCARHGAHSLPSSSDPSGPHHAVVLGAVAAAAGLAPAAAAGCATYGVVAGPAGAAVRLLGLDPLEVAGLLAELAPTLDIVATKAVEHLPTSQAGPGCDGPGCAGPGCAGPAWMALLPAPAAPLLDHLAEAHADREVRLFAS